MVTISVLNNISNKMYYTENFSPFLNSTHSTMLLKLHIFINIWYNVKSIVMLKNNTHSVADFHYRKKTAQKFSFLSE